jgi:hypothetical protein
MANRKLTLGQPINPSLQITDLVYTHSDGNVLDNPTMAGITQAASATVDTVTGETTGWTTHANWTIGSNKLTAASASTSNYVWKTNIIGLKNDVAYTVTYTISGSITGTIRIAIYGSSKVVYGTTRSAAGTYTETLTMDTASGDSEKILFQPMSTFTGSIENIFVSPVSTTKDTKVVHLLGKVTAIDRTLNTITYLEDSKSPTLHVGDFLLFTKNKNINQNGVKGRYANIKIENNSTSISKITDLAVGVTESSK